MVCNSDVTNINPDSNMNPGFSLYTNNNYIPGIGPFNAVQTCQTQQGQSDGMDPSTKSYIPGGEITLQLPGNRGGIPVQFPPSINNYPGSFTFAVPTQANSILSTFAQSTQPRDHMPCSVGITGAPGIGTHWQHSIPRLMPWQDAMSGQTTNGISTFTGLLPAVSHYEGYCDYLKGSNSSRSRLKRHALDSIKEESPENKVYISEEKMAKRMRELSLNCHASPPHHHNHTSSSSSSSTSSQFVSQCRSPPLLAKRPSPFRSSDNGSKRTYSHRMNDGRKRLKEIEDRLEVESSDEENIEEMEPRLHFTVNENNLLNPDPILPKQLINDLTNKPCLQVMLWKPPGDEIKKIISSSSSSSTSSSNGIFKRNNFEQSSIADICDDNNISDGSLLSSGLGAPIEDSNIWEDDMVL